MQLNKLLTKQGEEIDGPFIIEPHLFKDDRGLFFESWNKEKFNELVRKNTDFVQDNFSFSQKGVIRGLHYQLNPFPQAKLIRCSKGKIFDVIVDIRAKSPTYGKWIGVQLSDSDHKQIWVPEGFAHGFLALTDDVIVEYKTTHKWEKEFERAINWNDKEIGIEWPILKNDKYLLSPKDQIAPFLNKAKLSGEIF